MSIQSEKNRFLLGAINTSIEMLQSHDEDKLKRNRKIVHKFFKSEDHWGAMMKILEQISDFPTAWKEKITRRFNGLKDIYNDPDAPKPELPQQSQ